MRRSEEGKRKARQQDSEASPGKSSKQATDGNPHAQLRWPFPAGSQNETDKAVKLKPYLPPKRRSLNQY